MGLMQYRPPNRGSLEERRKESRRKEAKLEDLFNCGKKKSVRQVFEEIEDEEKALTLNEKEHELAYKMALDKHFQNYPELREYYNEMHWKGKKRKPRYYGHISLRPKRLFGDSQ